MIAIAPRAARFEKAMAENDGWVIAVRRDKRDEVPRDWVETVRGTPGVSSCGDASSVRVQVTATATAIASIRERLGAYVIVEPVMPRRRL